MYKAVKQTKLAVLLMVLAVFFSLPVLAAWDITQPTYDNSKGGIGNGELPFALPNQHSGVAPGAF
jgi:hypothetical protein